MLSPTRSKCGKAVYLTLHLLCSAGLLFWIILKHLKVIFVLLFFSSCGTDNKKRNCLIEKNLARTFITNIFWTRGLLGWCYSLFFLCRKLSMTQLLWKQLEQKLNFLLDIPKHIGKRTPKKTIWPLFFCQTLTYCHSNVYICLWLKLK